MGGNASVAHVVPAYVVNQADLRAIMPSLSAVDIKRYIGVLNEAMEEFQINTPKRAAAFLGQVSAETLQLNSAWWEEHISVYTGPNYVEYTINSSNPAHVQRAILNGNTAPGDGVKYHGRGPLQLT